MDEQASPPVDSDAASTPISEIPPPNVTPAPTKRRGSFFGRFVAALLVIVITAFIVLVTIAVIYVNLGFGLRTPQQLIMVDTIQAQNMALQVQNDFLQTQVAKQAQRGDTDHETLGELQNELAELNTLREQLRIEREQSASQNATLVAEVRDSRDAVALFATAEAGRVQLLTQLDQRSARIERFLQRLSDIAGDAAIDLANTTAIPAVPTPTAFDMTSTPIEDTPLPTDTPSPGATPLPSNTSLPATTAPTTTTSTATATRTATSSPVATSAGDDSPTPTVR